MIYVATGIVFLIFAVCIAYVFTEPAQTPQKQEAALVEQDAAQLTAQNTEEQKTPSADALVFTAQENTQTITTPPVQTEEQEKSSLSTVPLQEKTTPAHPAEKVNKTEPKQLAALEDKAAAPTTSAVSPSKATAPTAPAQEKNISETKQSEPKQAIQDKLPVPFVADSLKTRTILEPKRNTNTIVYAELMMDGNQVGLVFEGDKPIKPKTFRLNNPDRVVVDIEGYWVLKMPQLISNRMVKDIRSSAQQDKTRIVFDLKLPVSSSLLYRIHSRKYQLVFK